MTKVTVHETPPTPSEQLVAAAASEISIEDENGRIIKLRKPGVLAQFRLVEALGDTAANATYMNMVMPLIYIGSINGEPVLINTKREIEALIKQLGDEGVRAVQEGAYKHYGKKNQEADRDALKK